MTNCRNAGGPPLTLVADTSGAKVLSRDAITTGTVGLKLTLALSEEFDGLATTVCFEAGEAKADVAVLGGATEVEVPPQCLQEAGRILRIGAYADNAEGTRVISTVWASAGAVRQGVEPSGYDPAEPMPDWGAQVLQAAEDALETANSVRADADAGRFDGEDGYSPSATVTQLADGAEITITDKDGTTTATVHDGQTGPEGPAGFSPTAKVTQTATGATVTVTDQSGTTTADISNGAPGEVGPIGPQGPEGTSPTVDVQPIDGGHEVTITDARGSHSFDVMDGDPAQAGSITDEMLATDGIKSQVASMWGNRLTGELTGTVLTASDAYTAPPLAVGVGGSSTQDGTPTPDAPVDIKNVVNPVLCVAGKNLLPNDRFCAGNYNRPAGYVFNPATIGSGTVTDNGDGTFTMTAASEWAGVSFYTDVIPAGDYRLKLAFSGATPRVSIGFVNVETMQFVAQTSNYTTSGTYDRTITLPAPRIIVFSVASSSVGTIIITQPQLELGSTPTAYEPYQATTVTLPVTLRSLPDGTRDSATYTYLRPSTREGWAWYAGEVTRAVGHVADMGELSWTMNADNRYFTHRTADMNPTTATRLEGLLCTSYGMSSTSGLTPTSPEDKTMMRYGGSVVIRDSSQPTAADFKAACAGQTLLYELATPTTETLPEIELPSIVGPSCTIWATADATPELQVTYERDVNITIAALEAAYADLATS